MFGRFQSMGVERLSPTLEFPLVPSMWIMQRKRKERKNRKGEIMPWEFTERRRRRKKTEIAKFQSLVRTKTSFIRIDDIISRI